MQDTNGLVGDDSEKLTIDSLSEEKLSIDDVATSPLYRIKINDNSIKQLALTTAQLKGDQDKAQQDFSSIEKEMVVEGTRGEQERVAEEAREESMPQVQDALVNVLLDDTISLEGRQEAVNLALNKTSELFNLRKQLTTSLLAQDTDDESAYGERVRGNFASQIDLVNDLARHQTKILNTYAAATDSDTASALVDFYESALPFGRQQVVGDIMIALKKSMGEDVNEVGVRIKSFFQLGGLQQEIQEVIKAVPIEERAALSTKMAAIIEDNSKIILPDTNDFVLVDELRTMMESGYYGEGFAWVDTITGLLDLFLVGSSARRFGKEIASNIDAAKNARTLDDIISDLKTSRTFYGDAKIAPTSAGANAAQSNPKVARALFESSAADNATAKATYGTSSEDVITHYLNPKPYSISRDVEAAPSRMGETRDLNLSGDPALLQNIKKDDGKIFYEKQVKDSMSSAVYLDFNGGSGGIVYRENISKVGSDDSNGIGIRAIYGQSKDNGWATIEDAKISVMHAFRNYGIIESDLTILARNGDKYTPVDDLVDKGVSAGNYTVQINYNYEFNPSDVMAQADADMNYGIFDRIMASIPLGQAPLINFVQNASSLFSKQISLGALRAEDLSSSIEQTLLRVGSGFDEAYTNLPADKQQSLYSYIIEADAKNLKFDRIALIGKGFTGSEIKALEEWKKFTDTLYEFQNYDHTRNLNQQDWELYKQPGTELLVRGVSRNNIKATKFYDPATDTTVSRTSDELTELYDSGGMIMELRTPVLPAKGAEEITHIIVPQTPTNFSRKIREEDYISNYRESYFPTTYKDPIFIDKEFFDASGNLIRRETISRAGNRLDAQKEVDNLKLIDGDDATWSYSIRDNVRGDRTILDDTMDINISMGNSSQKFRGERIRSASATGEGKDKYLLDPLEALHNASRNIANRMAYGEYLDQSRGKFMANYQHLLDKKNGVYVFPETTADIKIRNKDRKEYLEAVGVWEYLRYLENGYVNGADELFKSLIRMAADEIGAASLKLSSRMPKVAKALSKDEELVRAFGELAPVGLSKNIAFQTMLGFNPVRQIWMQSHQAIVLSGLEPAYFIKGLFRETTAVIQYRLADGLVKVSGEQLANQAKNLAAKSMGLSRKEMDELMEVFENSGLASNISKHSMVQGALAQLGESWSIGNKAQRLTSAIASKPRKWGFDAGEQVNVITAWLTMRHRAIKAGQDFSRADVRAEVAARARDFTGGMNFAGDMIYNQNTIGLFFQFMQAPHKMMLLVSSNRNWTTTEKIRVAATQLAMFSLPPTISLGVMIPALKDILNPEVEEMVAFGINSYIVNAFLTWSVGYDVRMDFSGFSPVDMYGLWETITEMWVSDIGAALANTPAASGFFGRNPKITDAFKMSMRYFHLLEDEHESPESFAEVMKAWFSTTSGYSNYMNSRMAVLTGQKLSSTGKASELTPIEGWLAAAGVPPQKDTRRRIADKMAYYKSEQFDSDVENWYKESKRLYAKKGLSTGSTEFAEITHNKALMFFNEERPRFNALIKKFLTRDARDKDYTLWESVKRNANFMTIEEQVDYLNMTKAGTEETRKQHKEALYIIKSLITPEEEEEAKQLKLGRVSKAEREQASLIRARQKERSEEQ